ncbi:hypothetical protein FE634_21670 [Nocardioides dongxiaopingii]|uniref:hypothetical protein n=1 Tax=Nocardioides sp. S-1144 TaxID=2582905 RepID=UPI001164E26C|nr:hypothetical protein [Nocardioides sp. S-1144]QDH10828.1 hypothetical protein FE634_21670 [Nocardioides sp. S-1144]
MDVLESSGATGWRTVPALVRFKDGEELPGYRVLVVTGSCDNFFEGTLDDVGDRIPGAVFDPARGWDGSDIFWIEARPHFTFLATDRVRRALGSSGITGVVYEDAVD